MKATIVNLVTPHLLKVVDLVRPAETGSNIDWHLRDTVASTVDALAHQYNARDLVSSYIEGLHTAARDKGRVHGAYARALQDAAAQSTRLLEKL